MALLLDDGAVQDTSTLPVVEDSEVVTAEDVPGMELASTYVIEENDPYPKMFLALILNL